MLDYGGRHAMFTVATQSGPSAWGTHQQLSVLGAKGWLRLDFPFAHARPSACHIETGNESSAGSFPTTTYAFDPVNQYTLQVERFSRFLLGEDVPSWPIEDALGTLRTIEALFESAACRSWCALSSNAAGK
jgi:predicted dehydrogenase